MTFLDFKPARHITQNAVIHKAAVTGSGGMVVSQSRAASEVGLEVLKAGGNAADAAAAMAFALASAEPWNSGLGGIGFGVIRESNGRVHALDFGPVAPAALRPALFPTTGRTARDLFGWPEVEGDRNLHGPLSFCLPSAVSGYGLLHETFGKMPRTEILAPAVALAKRGLAADWYTTVKIAQCAGTLQR